jgi:hypothetical protein
MGVTPILSSVEQRQLSAVRILLENGANEQIEEMLESAALYGHMNQMIQWPYLFKISSDDLTCEEC